MRKKKRMCKGPTAEEIRIVIETKKGKTSYTAGRKMRIVWNDTAKTGNTESSESRRKRKKKSHVLSSKNDS